MIITSIKQKTLKFCMVLLVFVWPLLSFAVDNTINSLPDHIVGDIGGAIYTSNLHIGTEGTQSLILPYGFFDYQRFFARIDQVGFKTIEMGYGYLEVAGKINLDSYRVKSTINGYSINRSDPIPIGIGTFQETPIGGFLVNAYYDFGKSKGMLYELSYFGELETYKQVVIYPQIGIERQSNQYANYYYGINSGEATASGYSTYSASATTNLIAGLMIEIPVIDQWFLNLYAKRKWMGSGINGSPVMNRSFQDTIFTAIAYRFK